MSDLQVLIVESIPNQALALRYPIEKEGYTAQIAPSGVEALRMTRELHPKVILCDENLPDVEGCSLCRQLCGCVESGETKIMLMTDFSDREKLCHIMDAGVTVLLPKPVDELYLLSQIAKIARGQNATADSSQTSSLLQSAYSCAVEKNLELMAARRDLQETTASFLTLQKNFVQFLETNVDAILIYNQDHIVHYVNAAAIQTFSTQGARLLGKKVPFEPQASRTFEIEVADGEGQSKVLDGRTANIRWDGEYMTLASFRDITEASRLRKELEQMSLTDDLSGLYNRRGFSILAERMIPQAKRLGCHLFVLFADIDSLKSVNDTYGHRDGDKLICQTATLLSQSFRETDIVARIGGDEFAIMGIINENFIPEKLIDRLERAIQHFNDNRQHQYALSLSFGTESFDPNSSEPLEHILRKADLLMYANKNHKRRPD